VTLQPFAPPAPPGALLATVIYAPGTQQNYSPGTAVSVIDGANLSITFTVPASGKFYVDAGIDWGLFPASAAFQFTSDLFLGIALHGTAGATLLAPIQSVGGLSAPNSVANQPGIGGHSFHRFYSSGNTPGPITADLVMGISSVFEITGQFYAGPGNQAVTADPVAPVKIQAFAA
jgi:hypothetical protein